MLLDPNVLLSGGRSTEFRPLLRMWQLCSRFILDDRGRAFAAVCYLRTPSIALRPFSFLAFRLFPAFFRPPLSLLVFDSFELGIKIIGLSAILKFSRKFEEKFKREIWNVKWWPFVDTINLVRKLNIEMKLTFF